MSVGTSQFENISFYQLTIDETLAKLQTRREGLTGQEVTDRYQKYGRNVIPQPKSKSVIEIFIRQFLNPLIYVLIGAAIISVATGDASDAIFISAIVIINALLGTYQEWRAENSAQALRQMVKVKCRVRRDNRIVEVDAEDLVPGDVVLLESGNKVPADLRLMEANDLSVEEALLTGESVPVQKSLDPLSKEKDLPLGDRLNMVFAATAIQKGRGTGLVANTAAHTQIGRIADSLRTTQTEKPPLEKRMESFSRKISIIVLGVCIVLGVIGYLEGIPPRDIFFLMVAVGVAAIPEGLPVALTVTLSIGTRRMAKRNVIVRKLPAVEGLGSCTLIASDKTGTLTMDQQSVQKIYLADEKFYDITGQGYNGDGQIKHHGKVISETDEHLDRFLISSMLANEGTLHKTEKGWEHSGDSVDVAIRSLAYKIGKEPKYFQEKAELVKVVPYESERKSSGAFFRQNDKLHYAMKGAVEVVMNHLPDNIREKIFPVSEQMAAEGYRVIMLAAGEVQNENPDELPALNLLGLIGMIDPLRTEAKAAVEECLRAGITVVMITGDHPSTALSIGKSLGIAKDQDEIITGGELEVFDKIPPNELAEKIKDKKVFARVAPLQKQRIVEALKASGHFVAVTGDGANDAPALKSAHIGVAMGGGTDLAKEASSIIVTDNNFASIAAGVEEGRFTYENLRKIIYMLISTGAAELLTIAIAIIVNIPVPFLAVQLLWLNLVTNGIQEIAMAFEKGDKAVMEKPPRKPEENVFDKLMNSQMIISGLLIAGVVSGVWYYLLEANADQQHARTLVMMLMVLLQNFHALNCRSETKSLFQLPLRNNYTLIAGIILAQGIHIAASYIPFLNKTLHLEPIRLNEWIMLVPAAASVLVVMEIFKWIWRRNQSRT